MKKLILAAGLLVFSTGVYSQKIFFAYLQSDNGKPFFVRLNDRVHSSSASGYVILPRLRDSTYTIFVGFPGETAEQKFTISIPHKDKGYLLKDFGNEGWGLFDLQTMSVQKSLNAPAGVKTVPDDNVSPFTEILAKASDDPTLKEKTVVPAVQKEEVKVQKQETPPVVKEVPVDKSESDTAPSTVPAPAVEQASQSEKKEEVKEAVTAAPVTETGAVTGKEADSSATDQPVSTVKQEEVGVKTSGLTRIALEEREEGTYAVFIDRLADGSTDTIRLLVEAPKKVVVTEKKEAEEKKFLDITVQPTSDPVVSSAEKVSEKPVEPQKQEEVKPVPVTAAPEQVKETVPVPATTETPSNKTANACTETAQESDFIRLRRRMVGANDDDEMVLEARKGFREKCYTVYQVRNLGSLFLTDEGKYKLFDAAYPYVSDVHNFISLKLELKDGYWVKRFEAMLK